MRIYLSFSCFFNFIPYSNTTNDWKFQVKKLLIASSAKLLSVQSFGVNKTLCTLKLKSPQLPIFFVRDVAQRNNNEKRNQDRHNDAEKVNFLVDVLIRFPIVKKRIMIGMDDFVSTWHDFRRKEVSLIFRITSNVMKSWRFHFSLTSAWVLSPLWYKIWKRRKKRFQSIFNENCLHLVLPQKLF